MPIGCILKKGQTAYCGLEGNAQTFYFLSGDHACAHYDPRSEKNKNPPAASLLACPGCIDEFKRVKDQEQNSR